MKYSELKNRFKNKYVIRIVAGVLTVAMLGTGYGAYSVSAAKANDTESVASTETTTETADTDEIKKDLEDKIGSMISDQNQSDIGKEETVYMIADANGNVNNTIVSDWLINKDNEDTLEDASDLKDITNVKGDEEFTQDGNKLSWAANGSDIFYQGTTDKEAPISEKVTYYLDGEEIAADELAGKSGKVTIRFDYTNNEKTTTTIDGKKTDIYVPFSVMTGMVLDNSFSNVEVTNGKIISDGKNNIVVGIAMPGLQDSLGVDADDFDTDVEFPDYVEVTADVEDFALETTVTVATSNLMNELSMNGDLDLSFLSDTIDEMTDASTQLVDGSSKLSDGIKTLKDGIDSYTSGASTIDGYMAKLAEGTGTLANSVPTLTSGVSALKDGSDSALAGITTIDAGAAKLKSATGQLETGSGTIDESVKKVASGASDLKSGADTLVAGYTGTSKQTGVADGMKELNTGVATLCGGINTLLTGVESSKQTALTTATGIYASEDALKADAAATIGTAVTTAVTNLTKAVGVYSADGQLLYDLNAQLVKAGATSIMYMNADPTSTTPFTFKGSSAAEMQQNATALATTLAAQSTALGGDYSGKVTEFMTAAQNVQTYQTELANAVNTSVSTVLTKATGYAGQMGAYTALDTLETQMATAGLSSDSLSKLTSGASTLNTAINGGKLADGTKTPGLAAGTKSLAAGANDIDVAFNGGTTSDGKTTLTSDKALAAGVHTLASSLITLNDSVVGYDKADGTHVTGLAEGTSALKSGLATINTGLTTLNDSTPALASGVNTLNSSVAQLKTGADTLVSNNAKLTSGVTELLEGSVTLADGMEEFDEQAIEKLADTYNGDVKSLLDRVDAVMQAGEDYTTFSDVADGVNGSVKFIIRTDAVKAE